MQIIQIIANFSNAHKTTTKQPNNVHIICTNCSHTLRRRDKFWRNRSYQFGSSSQLISSSARRPLQLDPFTIVTINATRSGMQQFYMLIIITDSVVCRLLSLVFAHIIIMIIIKMQMMQSCHLPVAMLPMLQMQMLLQAFIIINTCNAQRNWNG